MKYKEVLLKPICEDGSSIATHPYINIRPNNEGNNSINIGRGHNTQIKDTEVSRAVANISIWVDPHNNQIKTYLTLKDTEQPFTVNGIVIKKEPDKETTVELKNGYIIALGKNKYRYRVEIPDGYMESMESVTKGEGAQDDPKRELINNTQCPICMDIIVGAMSMVPCAHLYCSRCIYKLGCCAICREIPYGITKERQVDSMIYNLVKIGETYPYDDAVQYLKRSNFTHFLDEFQWVKEQDKNEITSTIRNWQRHKRDHSCSCHSDDSDSTDVIDLTLTDSV